MLQPLQSLIILETMNNVWFWRINNNSSMPSTTKTHNTAKLKSFGAQITSHFAVSRKHCCTRHHEMERKAKKTTEQEPNIFSSHQKVSAVVLNGQGKVGECRETWSFYDDGRSGLPISLVISLDTTVQQSRCGYALQHLRRNAILPHVLRPLTYLASM